MEASRKKSKECAVRLQVMEAKVTRVSEGMRFDASVRSVVALQSVAFGTFVCADNKDNLVCDRSKIGKWEKFKCIPMGENKVGFQSEAFKKYVSVDRKGKATADKPHLKGHEKFEVVLNDDGSVSLMSFRGCYLMAQPDGRMTATKNDSGKPTAWERFMISVIRLESQ